ncbi:hypothetical protein [Glutamicibacter sp. BW80]|uniref:hypothetical protein n=1 Tax=Glutamicibacter sp. BW80 TaxID=2024404 RepID=UPI0020D09431|nr:hypothetical protein [Glutamicibacter sp. BW80]
MIDIISSVVEISAAANIPDPGATKPPGMGGVTTIIGWLKWIGFAVAGAAMVVAGILISVAFKRGEGHDVLPKILWPCLGAVVVGSGISWIALLAG